jgi:hypothetical protein
MPRLPELNVPAEYCVTLAQMVADTSWLPHPNTVKGLGGAAFPTVRARKNHPRLTHVLENGQPIGMYDDNATPAWTLLWSHEVKGRRKGWTVAHVWAETDCIDSFTQLANLALIPECFGSLTDKTGPLTNFLRWHAWQAYQWKPAQHAEPTKPDGYDSITWRYFEYVPDPKALILQRLKKLNNQRTRVLLPLMRCKV